MCVGVGGTQSCLLGRSTLEWDRDDICRSELVEGAPVCFRSGAGPCRS